MFNGQTLYDRQMRVKMDSMGATDKSSSMPLPSKFSILVNAVVNILINLSNIINMISWLEMKC